MRSIRSSLKRPIQSMGPLETPGAGHTRFAHELLRAFGYETRKKGPARNAPAGPRVATCGSLSPPSARRVARAGACGARPGRGPPEARAEPGPTPPGVAQAQNLLPFQNL